MSEEEREIMAIIARRLVEIYTQGMSMNLPADLKKLDTFAGNIRDERAEAERTVRIREKLTMAEQ